MSKLMTFKTVKIAFQGMFVAYKQPEVSLLFTLTALHKRLKAILFNATT